MQKFPSAPNTMYYRFMAFCGRQKAASFLVIFGTVWCMTSFMGYYREVKVPLAEDRVKNRKKFDF